MLCTTLLIAATYYENKFFNNYVQSHTRAITNQDPAFNTPMIIPVTTKTIYSNLDDEVLEDMLPEDMFQQRLVAEKESEEMSLNRRIDKLASQLALRKQQVHQSEINSMVELTEEELLLLSK